MNGTNVGAYIKAQLKKKGISQEKLANMLGITSSAVSQALSGKNTFDIENLKLISDILDASVDTIINAGNERETRTEKLAQMSLEEIMKRDPELSSIRTKDSKGLRLDDYAVKHRNVELVRFLQKHNINRTQSKNLRYLSLLVEHSELELLERALNSDYQANLSNIFKKSISELNKEEKELVEQIIRSKNQKIVHLFERFNSSNRSNQIPQIVLHSVAFDETYFIEEYIDRNKDDEHFVESYRHARFTPLLIRSIRHKSKTCIEYLHNRKTLNNRGYDHFEDEGLNENIFKELIESKDVAFIDWYLTKYVKRYQNDGNQKRIRHIKPLIQEDNVEVMTYATKLLSQDELDEALAGCKLDQLQMIKVLIGEGARISMPDSYGGGRLVSEPLTAIVKELISKTSSF